MKQKLALACALIHKPALLLLDEPTNGVDPIARREFWRLLTGLLAGGVTATRIEPFAPTLEDAFIALVGGRQT